MGYFESLDSDIKLESTPIGVSFSTLEYSHSSFLENLKNKSFSPTKIKSIIENNVELYFDYTSFTDPNSRAHMQAIWTNIDFLENLLELLKANEKFHQKLVNCYRRDINTIASDYFKAIMDKDSGVDKLLYNIVNHINADHIVPLSTNIPLSIAQRLCIANFGTMDLSVSKLRLISEIWTCAEYYEPILNTEQIIYIFYVFYKNGFGKLFCKAMRYVYVGDSKNIIQIDANISSALISILNSMSSPEIRDVLAKYSNYNLLVSNDEHHTRFSLKHLPAEFKNVAQCVIEGEKLGYHLI